MIKPPPLPVYPDMQTPARTSGLLALSVLALLGSACATGPEPDDEARLGVVFIAEDGRKLAVGSYDAESGELSFAPDAQDSMREQFADAGYSASVELDGEAAEIDFDAGVAFVRVDLEDGDALELRIAQPGSETLTLGRLVLQDGDTFRYGNKVGSDDWKSGGVS